MTKMNRSKIKSDWEILKDTSKEVASWAKWLQKNDDLLFEEE